MALKLEEFIRRKNIDHFRNLLGKTTDEAERKILLGLLAQEEATLAELPRASVSMRSSGS